MNEEKARKILGDTIVKDDWLYDGLNYTSWVPVTWNSDKVTLDGEFTSEELQAIACWMVNKNDN